MPASNYVHVRVERIIRETDRAFQVVLDGVDEALWLPKSQLADPDDYEAGDENLTMSISEWIAREKNIEWE